MKRLPMTIALAAWLLAACASAPWEGDAEARRPPPQQAERKEFPGVVENVREVEYGSERSGVAPMAGALIGGAVGSGVGHGRGAAVGGAVGAVVGAVAGEAAAQAAMQPGLEITVRLDEGRVIAVTEPVGKEAFKPADRVRVVSDGRTARVMR